MKRIVEPELMDAAEQAKAYAEADFSSAHETYPKLFAQRFPRRPKRGLALDLGCGPCDVTIRFAKANPGYTFHAVDGSAAMLRQAKRAIQRAEQTPHPSLSPSDGERVSAGRVRGNGFSQRIRLIEGFIPGAPIPKRSYDVILSSSFLHHLHEPQVLWQTVRERSRRGTIVFVPDLRRPATKAKVREFVKKYCGSEPEVLRRDFYNSLLAAFTPAEVRRQLKAAGLRGLKVEIISDRHLLVYGRID
ncbi:MAG: class I SAM-dependent methyltransferase [Verrucomicrobia bacterium]|nr:MAG: class I SAM-dependent methyltransferase [Verrucomicrobiota bacterium]